jgi:hypothetical protein
MVSGLRNLCAIAPDLWTQKAREHRGSGLLVSSYQIRFSASATSSGEHRYCRRPSFAPPFHRSCRRYSLQALGGGVLRDDLVSAVGLEFKLPTLGVGFDPNLHFGSIRCRGPVHIQAITCGMLRNQLIDAATLVFELPRLW